MNNIETTLEFDKIKEKWMEFANTNQAKEQIQNTEIFLSESELRAKQRETTEARMLLEKGGNPPIPSLSGISDLIQIAKMGECLSALQIEQIGNMLTAVSRFQDYLNRCKQFEVSLAYYADDLDSLPELREEIRMQIRNGSIDDSASKLLKSLRSEIGRLETKMREKAEATIRSNKECMSDQFATIRNGHICIPVKKEYKFRISGTVLDKSSTGNTLFIEPAQVAKYYEELQELRMDEENEERRILYTLTAVIADYAGILEENERIIEKLDFIFSKGYLSAWCDGVEPDINTDRRICIKEGRHPLMDRAVNVPLNLELGNVRTNQNPENSDIQGIVITGPNTGGKTVAIKTAALTCMMAQCGLHVACETADICMNSNYLCDIGDGQNISENLSTFSAHIVNVLDILKKVNRESFVIMDELGSGTDPTEGMGIAIAILNELKKSGALFLVTTHYPEVKEYAKKEKGIVNAKMAFDKESLRPLYRLEIGAAGESCAFYIAERLGMPADMIACAMEEAYPFGKQNVHQMQTQKENQTVNNVGITSGIKKEPSPRIQKKKQVKNQQEEAKKFKLGDSVMVYPDKKIGIVCQTANEKGVLRVQMPDKKIWINHKRVKLHVAAEELYPEDYDFSIIFDTVENRKLRHKMGRKYVEGEVLIEETE
ncbi:MAG: DNA mismatch repair protein MutS [Lachnospiraceae bacterium]|nr:DNA mismatch repair protein MutS [Lachnospiraceae bacterium]